MLKQFLQFVNDNRLFDRSHSLLAAVSGGADSLVMLHLLAQGRFKVSVAHCNFKLRGAEADADEQFVSQLAEKYGMPFFSISFDTTAYADEHKISIEMAARELRYNWFAQLAAEHGFDRILTAHHLDDNVETMILNICRGTGINGLAGISIVNGSIVRPLLFASRQQIEDYAAANGLAFRTDATNLTDDYQRNIVRHRIVPVMRQINPTFDERMLKNFSNIKQAAHIYNWYIDKAKSEVLQTEGNRTIINIGMLMRQPFAEPVLYECVSEFGFNSSQAEQMMKIIGQKSGFTFSSATHKLLIDRNQIIVEPLEDDDFQPVSISQPQNLPDLGITLQLVPASDFQIDRRQSVACLDFDKLQFPLTLRRWQNGDSFYPLGMNRAKKLSDFFIDNKIDLFEKEKTLVLVSAGKIAWIVGMRPDNRFKVDEKTKQVLVIVSQPVRKP